MSILFDTSFVFVVILVIKRYSRGLVNNQKEGQNGEQETYTKVKYKKQS